MLLLLTAFIFWQSGSSFFPVLLIQDAPPAPTPEEPSEVVPSEVIEQMDPEATRLLERSLEAMGGRAVRDGLISTRSIASLRMGERDTEFELLARGDDKFLVRHTITGVGRMEIGFDGRTGWRSDPPDQQITLISGREAAEFKKGFDFQALLRNLDQRFTTGRIQPAEEVEGVECDVVLLEKNDERLKVLFDRETGLIRAFEPVADGDRRRRRILIEEWSREAEPMRWVRRLRIEQPRTTVEATYSSVTFDDVADATFEAPAGIDPPEGAATK